MISLKWHTMTVPVLGEVLVNQNKAIEALLSEQRKRDLEEFREMVKELSFDCEASWAHERDILVKIDAKLSEIKT